MVSWLCEEGPRRPGELHEPIALGPDAERELERSARAAGQPASVAARLLFEAALLRADLLCARRADAQLALDAAAQTARVSRRLSAAEADYLRALRKPGEGERGGVVTIPVRLLGRLDEVDLCAALAGDSQRAADWEAAALLEGRTMLEWGLLAALRVTE